MIEIKNTQDNCKKKKFCYYQTFINLYNITVGVTQNKQTLGWNDGWKSYG